MFNKILFLCAALAFFGLAISAILTGETYGLSTLSAGSRKIDIQSDPIEFVFVNIIFLACGYFSFKAYMLIRNKH